MTKLPLKRSKERLTSLRANGSFVNCIGPLDRVHEGHFSKLASVRHTDRSISRCDRRVVWGGAGNVAVMTRALGAHTLLMGLIGRDVNEPLPDVDHFFSGWQHAAGRTTTKTRYCVNGRLRVPRVDCDLNARPQRIDRWMQGNVAWEPTAIIVADHGKGVVTAELMQALGELGVPVYVDPIQTTPLPFAPAAIAGGRHELSPAAHQAGLQCERRGCVPVTLEDLRASWEIRSADVGQSSSENC